VAAAIPRGAKPSHSAVFDRAGLIMLYERLLDLAPGARLERRLAERVAARLVIAFLLSLPLCAVAAFVLAAGAVHALFAGVWDAGQIAGFRLRDGFEAALAPR